MNIRDLHAELVTLFTGLAITQPSAKSIAKVFKYTPPARQALTDLPTMILTYDLQSVDFLPAFLEKKYSIHAQLFVHPAEVEADVNIDVASAFLDAIVDKLSATQLLVGNVSVIRGLRGGGAHMETRETVSILEWAGAGFVGLDLYMDVTLKETRQHQP